MITKCFKKVENSTISSLFAGIVIIMAMFLSVACEKDETNVTDQQQTVRKPQPISDMEVMQYLPEVVDGRLVFKDSVSYEYYLQWVFENQGNPEKIDEMNLKLGFVSLKEIYNNGIILLENSPEEGKKFIKQFPNVFNKVTYDNSVLYEMSIPNTLAYVSNQYGICQVGERIFKATYNYCYTALKSDDSIIEKLKFMSESCTGDDLIISAPTHTEKHGETYNTAYFDDTHRIVIRLKPGLFNGKYYITALTHSQQKIIVWIGKALQGVYVSKAAGYYYPLGSNVKYTIYSDLDAANQEASLDIYSNSVEADPARSYCSTLHYGEYDDEYIYFTHSNVFPSVYY
jgi:hypothetical protein